VVCAKYDWISEIFKECYSLPHPVMEKTTEGDKSSQSAEVAIVVWLHPLFSLLQDGYVLNYVIAAAS